MGVPMMRVLEGDKYDRQYTDGYLVRRILQYFQAYRAQAISVIVGYFFLALVAALRPVLISAGVNALEDNNPNNMLQLLVGALLVAAVTEYLMQRRC
jgi:ABC-type bacteriocin/lantibiotic exporter with double-glycine peptidase domain